MNVLQDKVALVTGASGGLGSEIAKTLHAKGAHVVLSGTRENRLMEVQRHLGNERVSVVPCPLNAPEKIVEMVKTIQTEWGGVDILVNNAGMTRDTLLMRMKDEDWQTVLDINLTSIFHLTRACLKPMMKKRWGRIINISSIVGFTGNPGQCNYAATKAGVVGFSKSLAQEVASRGITVNCIAPGFIESAMTDELTPEQKHGIVSRIPMGHIGKPEDIAEATLFLAGPKAGYITGQTLHVNGGMAMI